MINTYPYYEGLDYNSLKIQVGNSGQNHFVLGFVRFGLFGNVFDRSVSSVDTGEKIWSVSTLMNPTSTCQTQKQKSLILTKLHTNT